LTLTGAFPTLAIGTEFISDLLRCPETPKTEEELLPLPAEKEVEETSRIGYQRKVDSILFAAILTRPDIVFAAARLSIECDNRQTIRLLVEEVAKLQLNYAMSTSIPIIINVISYLHSSPTRNYRSQAVQVPSKMSQHIQ
jgi:hypothetical protein